MMKGETLGMISEFLAASELLVEIVEGVRGYEFKSPRGARLVDTPEWCAFYVRWCEIQLAVAKQEETKAPPQYDFISIVSRYGKPEFEMHDTEADAVTHLEQGENQGDCYAAGVYQVSTDTMLHGDALNKYDTEKVKNSAREFVKKEANA